MDIHTAQRNWESATLAKHQKEIDRADLFDRECESMTEALWDETAGDIYDRLEESSKKHSRADDALRDFLKAVENASAILVEFEECEP